MAESTMIVNDSLNEKLASATKLSVGSDLSDYSYVMVCFEDGSNNPTQNMQLYVKWFYTVYRPTHRLIVFPGKFESGVGTGFGYCIYSNKVITTITENVEIWGVK